MKKIITVGLAIMMSITALALTVVAEDDKPPIRAPFEAFTIQYRVDPHHPDPLRDNQPMIEYDPDEGWNFYKVELKPTENVERVYRYRVCLNDEDKRIQIHPEDEEFLSYMNDIFDVKVWFQLNGDFYSDSLCISYFCKPRLAGDHDNVSKTHLLSMKLNKKDDAYISMINYGSESKLESYAFNPKIGTIQILEKNLQFEQWDIDGNVYSLSQRVALNPDLIDTRKIPRFTEYFFKHAVSHTSVYKGYIEYFVGEEKFIFLGEEHYFDKYESKKYDVPNYNCCRRYKGEIVVPLRSFAEMMGFTYGSWNFETNKCVNGSPYIEHYVWRSINQRIIFKIGEKVAKTRYGEDIELPIAPFIIPDDTNIYTSEYHYRGIFTPMIPLIPLLESLPRYSVEGYYYRPMNDSILISRTINTDSYRDERIIID